MHAHTPTRPFGVRDRFLQALLDAVECRPSLVLAAPLQHISLMKSAMLPQVCVDPECRCKNAEFHTQGEVAWQEYLRSGVTHPADQIIGEMRELLEFKRQQLGVPPAKAR